MSTLATNNIVPATGSTVSIPAFAPSVQMGNKNKIINGKMEIAQRGTTYLPLPVNSYFLDRWVYNATTTAVINAAQHLDAPTAEYRSSLRTEVTTADISIATGDNAVISQRIEGFNARDLISRTFTLSFWVRSSKTGTHCVFFKNGGNDRSYVAEYTISAANTWEQKSITVSGGLITAGAWDWASGVGLQVGFVLACGSTYHNTANAWNTGNFLATANQVNCLDTIGNIFAITGVQLEVGSVATPFEHRPYGAELALCQRYFEDLTSVPFIVHMEAAGAPRGPVFFKTQKRATATIIVSGSAADYALYDTTLRVCTVLPALDGGTSGAILVNNCVSGGVGGQAARFFAHTANARIYASAEL